MKWLNDNLALNGDLTFKLQAKAIKQQNSVKQSKVKTVKTI